MENKFYHYTECGLENIYLSNGYRFQETPRGRSVAFHDIDGLHKAIGSFLVTMKKDLTGPEVRFLRNEMLISQAAFARLLGVSDQAVARWEKGQIQIPKPSESLLRLLYREHIREHENSISTALKRIADLENEIHDHILFKDTSSGWRAIA